MQPDLDLRGCVAFSYARFSDPSQGAGHSIERQRDYAPEFCKEYGCKLDETLSFADHGKSAFHGKHVAEGGGLSRFLECIRAGRVKPNDILIVENLDRMSRLPLASAEDLLKSILQTGVRIHTRSPWQLFDRSTLNDPMQRMQMIFEFTRSHRESKYKQERLARRWQLNRSLIRKGEYHLSNLPGWLRKAKHGYELVPEKVEIVKRIFELCISGSGLTAIVKELNNQSIQPFGRSNGWARSSVSKILRNRAVLGEYQPHTTVKLDGKDIHSSARAPSGDIIANHYPAIITQETFDRAQLALHKRVVHQAGAGTDKAVNLFPSLIYDVRDKAKMHLVDKGFGPQLVSEKATKGLSVENVYVPYLMVENSFAAFVDRMPLDMVVPRQTGDLERKISETQKRLEALELQVAKIREKLRTTISDSLLDLLVERDTEIKQATSDIELLKRQVGTTATVAANTSKEVLALFKKAKGDELIALRRKLRNEIRYWVTQVNVLPLKLGGVKAAIVAVQLANSDRIDFRCAEEPIEWPTVFDELDILEFDSWEEAHKRTTWEALTLQDKKILELDDSNLPLELIAEETGLTISVVSRRLIKHGRRRSKRSTLGKDRQMTWNSAANGWQRTFDGKRYYVGVGTLKSLYPRIVTSNDEAGTLKAANRWWKEHVQNQN